MYFERPGEGGGGWNGLLRNTWISEEDVEAADLNPDAVDGAAFGAVCSDESGRHFWNPKDIPDDVADDWRKR